MKYFLLIYDPASERDPSVLPFGNERAAFKALESRTIANLGRNGVEVVLFYADSEEALRSANPRYFNPEASRRLRENPEVLHQDFEQFTDRIAAIASGDLVASARGE